MQITSGLGASLREKSLAQALARALSQSAALTVPALPPEP
jgi:hypothetical protein